MTDTHTPENSSQPAGQQTPPTLHRDHVHVVTWNILHDNYKRDTRLRNIAAHLQATQPDIVLLQEAWNGASEQLADTINYHLAGQTGHTLICSILSKHPPQKPGNALTLPGDNAIGEPIQAIHATITSPRGRTWHAISTHLSWGGNAEHQRLSQAHAINQYAEKHVADEPESVTILGGDFNTTPDSGTLNYLTGKTSHQETSTYWVDAWDKAGTGDPTTSNPDNDLARGTARKVGILDTGLLPKRRIDYILTHGYAHGRAGCPLRCHVQHPPHTSDHGAVHAHLWDPKPAKT